MKTVRAQAPAPRQSRSQRALSPILRVALLLGVAVHLAGFLIFKITSKRLPSYEETPAFVQFVTAGEAEEDSEFIESASLLDSAPLFVPTRWNAARTGWSRPSAGEQVLFSEFEPEIDLVGELQPAYLESALDYALETPGDLLVADRAAVFVEFGRGGGQIRAFETGGPVARFELVRPLDGRLTESPEPVVMEVDLPMPEDPLLLQPAEFFLRLSGDGRAIGSPILGSTSGSPAFDAAARLWLRSQATLGRLPAGFIKVRIYP